MLQVGATGIEEVSFQILSSYPAIPSILEYASLGIDRIVMETKSQTISICSLNEFLAQFIIFFIIINCK
jgi:hypothetical protein